MMMLSSALDAQTPGFSLSQLYSDFGLSDRQIRDDIKRITPMINTLSLGMMYPYSGKWQFGGDFVVSSLSSADASQVLPNTSVGIGPYRPASPGSGNTFSYIARAIGNSILWTNDLLVLSGNYIDAAHTTTVPTYNAEAFTATHVARPNDNWQFDTSLLLYFQNQSDGQTTTRINPAFKALYHWKKNISFESSASIEREQIKNGLSPGHTLRSYYYLGYRWDWN